MYLNIITYSNNLKIQLEYTIKDPNFNKLLLKY